MKITEEMLLADVALRKRLIESFSEGKNAQRKYEAFKAYECLKDKTVNYVLQLIRAQFDLETVYEMQYALSNISILRKVIDKLAKVYANGVKRTMPEKVKKKKPEPLSTEPPVDQAADPNAEPADPLNPGASKEADAAKAIAEEVTKISPDTQSVEKVAELLNVNAAMKKANRYFRTFKNCLVYVKPLETEADKYRIDVSVKAPFSYDVVEDPNDPTQAMAVILSDYVTKRETLYSVIDAALVGRSKNGTGVVRQMGKPEIGDAVPANYPSSLTRSFSSTTGNTPDAAADDNRQFIWWTKNFHFTTNVKGEIIDALSPPDKKNPIEELPFVAISGEQDECFWAEGGEDLVDAGIKINAMITNLRSIGVTQGYGQMYMIGPRLPKSIKVGPSHCVQMEITEGEQGKAEFGFASSNPPLADLRELVEMDVALMLSTNNLSTSGFSTKLGSGKDFASGIALMIDKSDSTEDITEQQQVFAQKEPQVFKLIYGWMNYYKSKGALDESMASIKLVKKPEELQTIFPVVKPIASEMDNLDAIEKRRDLGLNTDVELLMRDDPTLTEEEAQLKLEKIAAEKKVKSDVAQASMMEQNGNQGQEGNGFGQQNGGNARPGAKPAFAGQAPNPNKK